MLSVRIACPGACLGRSLKGKERFQFDERFYTDTAQRKAYVDDWLPTYNFDEHVDIIDEFDVEYDGEDFVDDGEPV